MNYEVEFSKRKSISITVKGNRVIVKAPFRTPRAVMDKLVAEHRAWIERRLIIEEEKQGFNSNLTPDAIKRLKALARIYFKEKIDKYSDLMGLKYSSMKITSAERRFGSCSAKGNICFSYRLMLYPEAAREYVIVHELAHLKEMNHSKRFYAVIEEIMPDWRERRRILAKIDYDFAENMLSK